MRAADQLRVAGAALRALRSQWWPAERIRAFQERALTDLMRHAVTHVPYYQRLGIAADELRSSADLQRFPLLDKRAIQRDPEAFLARDVDRQKLYCSRTSGSSGQPTTTWFDADAWLLTRFALKMRRIAATGGLPLLRRVLIISEQREEDLAASAAGAPSGLGVLFRTLRLSIHTPVAEHLEAIRRYRPHLVYAYPSYLLDLIEEAAARAVALPPVRALYTSSEVLTPAARARIEAAWQTRVFDVYGSTEFKEVAWQCAAGRYHLNFESTFIEPPAGGEAGPVLLTTLCNRAMPLLRFDIGDQAHFAPPGRCDCGRESPQLLAFTGREGDMLVLPGGRRVTPYVLTTAIESEPSILQYRIVQTASDALRIDVVTATPGSSARWAPAVGQSLRQLLDGQVAVSVREVERLERDPSGKRSVFKRLAAAHG